MLNHSQPSSRPRSRRRRWALLVLVAVPLAASEPAAAEFAPVEGVWQTTTSIHGAFVVQRSGPDTFRSAIIEGDAPGSPCRGDEDNFIAPVVGHGREDYLTGSGLTYTGTSSLWQLDRFSGTCTYLGETPARADIVSTNPADYRMRYCGRGSLDGGPLFGPSGAPAPGTNCTTFVRVRTPQTPVDAARQVVRLPAAATGRARCGRPAPRMTLRVANPANEPLTSLVIRTGQRIAARLSYPVTASRVRIRVPRRSFRLTVSLTTATRKQLSESRRYGRCG